jgi:twitching motility protein PilI
MANKEALRELQTRLAGRLQLAREDVASAAWLAARVGPLNILLPLTQSGEIFALPGLAKVPYARPWLLGVVNLRGGLYSAVDLANFMDGKEPPVRSEQAWAQVRLVTFNPELELNAALLVDALLGLRRADAFVSSHSAPAGSADYLGQVCVDAQGVEWQEINMQFLAQSQAFLDVGA